MIDLCKALAFISFLSSAAYSLEVGKSLQPAPKKPEPPAEKGKGREDAHDAHDAIVWEKSFEAAQEAASKRGAPLMIDFEAEWCGFCKKLDRETYTDELVIRLVRENFVAVKVDVDRAPELQKKFNVEGLPTIVFLSPSGEELQRIEGFRPPELFVKDARKSAESSASLSRFRELAEKSPQDVPAQRAYARALFAAGNFDGAERVLRTALENAPKDLEAALCLDLADALRVSGKNARAREAYEKALSAKPGLPGEERRKALLPLARVLISLREPSKAVEALDDCLKDAVVAGKERLEALFLRGYAHALQKDAPKALEDLKAARDADPSGRWGMRASLILETVEAK